MKYIIPLAFIFCISCAEQAAVTTSSANANSSYSGSMGATTNASQSTSSLSKDNNTNATHNTRDNHVRENTSHETSQIK